MALKIENRIYVSTHNGEREIQLCLGDITHLAKEDTVDVIIVSAYPGDYIPMRNTLIGALKFNLGLNVEKLAKFHKKEDLRKNFSCWISDYLPARLPFRQLMCFERAAFQVKEMDILTAVQHMFRAMQPLFNNQNKSVITPLLATGCQGVDHDVMLLETVKAAVMWMRLGLPLQTLKIVIYTSGTLQHTTKTCIELFSKWKKKIEARPSVFKEPQIERDLFFVYSPSDKETALKVEKYIRQEKKKCKVCTIEDIETKASTWHHDVFTAMMASKRIVPLLSKAFLESESCLDQYNIALCCNRFLTSRHILAPLCLERHAMPTYMSMVQWINCRGHEGEKLDTASSILLDQILRGNETSQEAKFEYDIFLSYAHKNVDKAKEFLKLLQDKDSNLKIFFDYDELKTGVSWQKALYKSVDGSRCFIALLSRDYQTSVVCSEEFNLALAKYHAKGNAMSLVLLSIEDIETTSPAYRGLRILDACGSNFSKTTAQILQPLTDWLKTGTQHPDIFSDDTDLIDLNQLAETERKTQFNKHYTIDRDQGRVRFGQVTLGNTNTQAKKVFLSYSLRDQGFVHMITRLLKTYDPSIEISDKMAESTLQLDSAAYVIVFLSVHYRRSRKEMEEFNLILSKHRGGKSHLYVITLGTMPVTPTYLNLVPSYTSLADEFWEDVLPNGQGQDVLGEKLFGEMIELIGECQKTYHTDLTMPEALALYKSACDLEMILSIESNKFYEKVGYPKGVFVNVQLLQHRQLGLLEKPTEITLEENTDVSPMRGGGEQSGENGGLIQENQICNAQKQVIDSSQQATTGPKENDINKALDSTQDFSGEIDAETGEKKNANESSSGSKAALFKESNASEDVKGDKSTRNQEDKGPAVSPRLDPGIELFTEPSDKDEADKDGGGGSEEDEERDTIADLVHDRKNTAERRRKWQQEKQREAERSAHPPKTTAMCHLL